MRHGREGLFSRGQNLLFSKGGREGVRAPSEKEERGFSLFISLLLPLRSGDFLLVRTVVGLGGKYSRASLVQGGEKRDLWKYMLSSFGRGKEGRLIEKVFPAPFSGQGSITRETSPSSGRKRTCSVGPGRRKRGRHYCSSSMGGHGERGVGLVGCPRERI